MAYDLPAWTAHGSATHAPCIIWRNNPETLAYGRVLADGALLIYLGCLGLLMHSHGTSVEALFVALIAYALYRCTRYIDSPTIKNACLLGLALGALALTNGLVTTLRVVSVVS